jgi:DNA-binding transcriptional regulator YiaG
MPNVAQVLKDEIRRIAKAQAKLMTTDLKKDVVWLKHTVAEQKRRIATLERDKNWLVESEKRRIKEAPVAPATDTKARITAKGMRAQRKKLGLSQSDFGKLIGVSTVTVCLWEKKQGALKLRDKTRAAILAVRGIGAQEAKKRIDVLGK